jgi:hypothetical protein
MFCKVTLLMLLGLNEPEDKVRNESSEMCKIKILRKAGLLLNAPYKIDSMVWMRMMIRFYDSLRCFSLYSCGGYMNQKGILG